MARPYGFVEPVAYELEVISPERPCRSGLRPGQKWLFEWNTPEGFCPKAFLLLFPLMIACETGGDLRERGGKSCDSIEFSCPDNEVRFRLRAQRQVPTIASIETRET